MNAPTMPPRWARWATLLVLSKAITISSSAYTQMNVFIRKEIGGNNNEMTEFGKAIAAAAITPNSAPLAPTQPPYTLTRR